jgi:tetratricopeptide (TPR) repeat protein
MSDEDILRMILVRLSGDQSAGLSREAKKLASLIEKARDLLYGLEFARARRVLSEAWQLAEVVGDDQAKAWVRQYQGRAERDSGNLDAAMVLYQQAKALAELADDTEVLAVILDQIGRTYRLRGDLDQARIYFQLAVATDPSAKSFAIGNLAMLEEDSGRSDRAEKLEAQASAAYAEQGNQRGEAVIHVHRVAASVAAGDLVAAFRGALEAYQMGEATGHAQVMANASGILPDIRAALHQSQDAVPIFRQILSLDQLQQVLPYFLDVAIDAFRYAMSRQRHADAAEFGWRIATIANARQRSAVIGRRLERRFQKDLLRIQDALEAEHRRAAATEPGSAGAAAALGLAYCHATQGQVVLAREFAREAASQFQRCGDDSRADAARQLLGEHGTPA